MNKRKRGFTLIELLVVVAIIGMLSSIVIASLNSARAKARNASRNEELVQLRTAFVMAASNSNPYPNSSYQYPCVSASCYEGWGSFTADATVDAYLAPYMKKPTDPTGGTGPGMRHGGHAKRRERERE